jgi:hypothetical protein
LKKKHIVDTQQQEHVYSEKRIMLNCNHHFIAKSVLEKKTIINRSLKQQTISQSRRQKVIKACEILLSKHLLTAMQNTAV